MSFPLPPDSKARVRKAGKAIAAKTETQEDIAIVDQWRASHGYVLNTFKIWLKRALEREGVEAEFAQRLKRRNTVIDKLCRTRPDGTSFISDVTSMHDFAGCRLIFASIEDLTKFREALHSPQTMRNINHKLRNELNKYNYIENPKLSGYRGIHDVFRHFPRPHRRGTNTSEPWHGLQVEIQYRTRVQHAWATALEISDLVDGQRTKFDLHGGDRVEFFAVASEILAREQEGLKRAFLEKTRDELRLRLQELETKLGILQRLEALKQFDGFEKLGKHNVLNIVFSGKEHSLEVYRFNSPQKAVTKANELESEASSLNAVYVRADNPNQLRSAYRNYFNDPLDFVRMLK
ncbi:RelA/SpoT domain-containing protein [Leisingera sp. F5]|uniref:RelA/SpoT domain-containing protein n=1 Tax=Leisingera sp. F5 TaxID=1813816 RepID=UPI000B13470A|nr:RelA/SpoT domain-containing protein [Leisingera sp. F5]